MTPLQQIRQNLTEQLALLDIMEQINGEELPTVVLHAPSHEIGGIVAITAHTEATAITAFNMATSINHRLMREFSVRNNKPIDYSRKLTKLEFAKARDEMYLVINNNSKIA